VGGGAVTGYQSADEVGQSVEDEVRDNILNQSVGPGTLADYHLPDEFVRRVADRIIISSYQERYRMVVRDPPPAVAAGPENPSDRSRARTTAPYWAAGVVLLVAVVAVARMARRSRADGEGPR